jgi:hypothetical protein
VTRSLATLATSIMSKRMVGILLVHFIIIFYRLSRTKIIIQAIMIYPHCTTMDRVMFLVLQVVGTDTIFELNERHLPRVRYNCSFEVTKFSGHL